MLSPKLLNDVSTCHTNGMAITTAVIASTRWVATDPQRLGRIAGLDSALAIVHPPPLQPELDDGEQRDQQQQNEGDGSSVSTIVLHEGALIEQIHDRHRLLQRRIL